MELLPELCIIGKDRQQFNVVHKLTPNFSYVICCYRTQSRSAGCRETLTAVLPEDRLVQKVQRSRELLTLLIHLSGKYLWLKRSSSDNVFICFVSLGYLNITLIVFITNTRNDKVNTYLLN